MLIEEIDLVLSPLFRNVSLFVVSCLQRRSIARRCAISISQVFFGRLSVSQNTQQETEEQPIRRLKKETESSFIASCYPWH
jgi:hypothetical protein